MIGMRERGCIRAMRKAVPFAPSPIPRPSGYMALNLANSLLVGVYSPIPCSMASR
jgi:hypothetical protein